MSCNGATVDNHALQRGHQSATDDGHHKKGGTERGIFKANVFQGGAVDGREHQAHEEADADETVEACFADNQYRTQRTDRSTDSENGQEFSTVNVFHQGLRLCPRSGFQAPS